MALHILQNGRLALVTDLDRENARVKRFVIELVQDLVVIEYECPGRTPASVHDCRNLSVATQAAARTLPLVLTELCNQAEFLSHCDSPTFYLIDFAVLSGAFPGLRPRPAGNRARMLAQLQGLSQKGRGESRPAPGSLRR
jgi:hypothetical protein